jgi:hypothetical protein
MSMSQTILKAFFYALLIFSLTGCYTLSQVNFGNGTGASFKVKTSQTGQEINIPAGSFRKLPHAIGNLIVTTQKNGQFKFSDVVPLDLDDSYLVKRTSPFGPGYVTLNIMLKTNMDLYVLLPGKKTVDMSIPQPNGYPKTGKKIAD